MKTVAILLPDERHANRTREQAARIICGRVIMFRCCQLGTCAPRWCPCRDGYRAVLRARVRDHLGARGPRGAGLDHIRRRPPTRSRAPVSALSARFSRRWRSPGPAGGATGFGRWRTNPAWILLALARPARAPGRDGSLRRHRGPPAQWFYPPSTPETVAALVVFPLGEEFGWRGFAYPRLAARFGVCAAA